MSAPMSARTFRIGLWVDGPTATRQERQFIDRLGARADVALVALAPNHAPAQRPRTLLDALTSLEGAKLVRNARYRDHLSAFDFGPCHSESQADVAKLGLDMVVYLGCRMPPAEVVSASRLGLLAFEWARPGAQDQPLGFWEVFDRRETTGFAVQLLARGDSNGRVLLRGRVPTRHYYLLNRVALLDKATHYLVALLLDGVRNAGEFPAGPAGPAAAGSARSAPGPGAVLSYAWRSLRSTVAKKVLALSRREVRWQVSFAKTPWQSTALSEGRLIDNPSGRYLADPFVIQRDGRDYCFVEDFDCATQRGGISVYELEQATARRVGMAIDEPFHMSFPYLFEYDGALFMCPETSAHRDIRIYRCVDFPLQWQFEKALMTDVRAADTMLFERDGRWWMLTNLDPADTGEICSELYVFWAESPLSTVWHAHPSNPVIFDAGFARNGGLLRDGDTVFRVSQRQGFDRYGQGSQVNEIVTLDETRYEERTVMRIDPVFRPGLLGTHHLHSRQGVTVFDFARMTA